MTDASSTPAAAEGKLHWFARKWLAVVDYLSANLVGGPKCIKLAWVVNFQKGATIFFCLYLMRTYDNTSPTAITYTALHGSYGLCWLLKECIFPDPKWQVNITVFSAISAVLSVLGPYWFIPYTTIAGRVECTPFTLCAATIVYVLGVIIMMGADCQKYFVLRVKRGLITDGFFSRVRHPNYLGEMMLYGSFAWVSQDPRSWAILFYVWGGLFLPYMLRKEASMSRYEGWKAYTKKAGFLFPRLW